MKTLHKNILWFLTFITRILKVITNYKLPITFFMSEMCYLFKHCLKDNKRNVDEKTVGLFYFSGEGAQDSDESKNYLIPIEANIRNSYDLKHQSVAVEEIVETMEQTGAMNIVIIDACRNNL